MASPHCLPLKRKHSECNLHDTAEEPIAKRKKTFASGYPPRFWDTLSKVKLTRRALIEFTQRASSNRPETSSIRRRAQESAFRRRRRSTTKQVKQIAHQGGPSLGKLRGYAEMSQTNGDENRSSGRKRSHSLVAGSQEAVPKIKKSKTTPYSAEFEQKMIDLGVFPWRYLTPDDTEPPNPDNIEDLKEMLSRRRPSLSLSNFSQSEFEDFRKRTRVVKSEAEAMSNVFPIIAGSNDKDFHPTGNIVFNCVDIFGEGLSAPKPDRYYGAHPSQIDQAIRRDLESSIVPATRKELPAAPNFFVEGKSAEGRIDVAWRQAMYDAAIGARGIHQLQNYGNSATVWDGNAYTLSSVYHSATGFLQIFATHPRESESRLGQTSYYMTELGTYQLTYSREILAAGAAAWRNARQWTREQRNSIIAKANATIQTASANTTTTNGNTSTITEALEEEETPLDATTTDRNRSTINEQPEEGETPLDAITIDENRSTINEQPEEGQTPRDATTTDRNRSTINKEPEEEETPRNATTTDRNRSTINEQPEKEKTPPEATAMPPRPKPKKSSARGKRAAQRGRSQAK